MSYHTTLTLPHPDYLYIILCREARDALNDKSIRCGLTEKEVHCHAALSKLLDTWGILPNYTMPEPARIS